MGADFTDEHRDSESSYNHEYDGLVTGVSRQTARKKFATIIKLIPAFLVLSVTLNIVQFVYLVVHKPQCLSPYGTPLI